jgi:hypothetical protein
MDVEKIKNWDKLSPYDKEFLKTWAQITTVTINDDGIWMLDIISDPGFSEAKLHDINS